ncbi:MAG TPA: FHA domain-containing protein [Polyangiaceae bacterium]|nr:FHA domain-containing protein [Polyangiaceae bacterium]
MSRAVRWRLLIEKSSVLRPSKPGERVELHVVVEVVGAGPPVERSRAPLAVVLILDASASMKGESMQKLRRASQLIAGMLGPEDRIGAVAFADRATEILALSEATADTKRALQRRIEALEPLGRTNFGACLAEGKKQLGARREDERRVAVLLSAGRAIVGVNTSAEFERLAASYRPDAALSTLGFGQERLTDLLPKLARAGGGNYAFIVDPDEDSTDLSRAIGSQVDIVADDIQLVLVPEEGVEIVEVYDHKPRFTRDGVLCDLPALRGEGAHVVVAKVSFEAGHERGAQKLLRVKLGYRAAGERDVVQAEATASSVVADRDAVDVEASAFIGLAVSKRLLERATSAAEQGNFEAATALLSDAIAGLQGVPGYRAMDGSALSEAVEELVDLKATYGRRPSTGEEGVDRNLSAILVQSRTGETYRFSLAGADFIVGRAPGSDVCLPGGKVSKKHARFFFRDGTLFVTDLHSTNGTYVNRVRVDEPRAVGPGDRVYIGSYVFRLEQPPEHEKPPGTVVPFPRR